MIIKAYQPNGAPDLSQWRVTCDTPGCPHVTPLVGSRDWLIPAYPDMPCYCPTCTIGHAAHLVARAIMCPGCGSADIRLHVNNQTDGAGRWPNYADCGTCHQVIALLDGSL